MSKANNFVFNVLHIVAWLIFVGLSIEAGALLVNFIFSELKPSMLGNLYQKLDLRAIYQQSKMTYYGMYAFVLSIAILKAYLFYIVVILLHKMNLSTPFSPYVSKQITKISYFTLEIGVLSLIAQHVANNLQEHGFAVDGLQIFWEDADGFILMAAVVYIIATIFKKGIELQNENDLTV